MCVGILNGDSGNISVACTSLFAQRSHIHLADIAFNYDGTITVASTDGLLLSPILCSQVSLQLKDNECVISVKSCPSFCLNSQTDSSFIVDQTKITHLQFLSRESDNNLLVGVGDKMRSRIELWQISSQKVFVHRHFVPNLSDQPYYTTSKWTYQDDIKYPGTAASLACPQLPIVGNATETSPFQYIAIAYHDGTLRLVNRHNLQIMTMANLDTTILGEGVKQKKVVPYLCHICQSLSGCVLAGVDQLGCMYVMQMVNTRDPMTQVVPQYLVSLLEYCLITGSDWWDVVAVIKPGKI